MTAIRILRANAEEVDGEITESQFARVKSEELVIECPDCTAKLREAINDARVYHPNVSDDDAHERTVRRISVILTEKAN